MSDGPLTAFPVEYVCRVCEHEMAVYVSPEVRDGDPALTHTHKLTQQWCPDCEADRTYIMLDWMELDVDHPHPDGE